MIQIYPRLQQLVQYSRSFLRKEKFKKPLFCSKPFSWLEPSSDGLAYLCCPGWLPVPLGDWRSQSLDKLWNSSIAKSIRLSIIDGSFRYCNESLCPFLQTLSGPVMNLSDALKHEKWGQIIRNKKTMINSLSEINCAYDRSCNLKCFSCRKKLITNPHYNVDRLQTDIIKQLPSLEHLYITGSGDPFASKTLWALLTSIDGSIFPDLTITLHTNGLLFNKERWEKLKKIHYNIKKIHVSIDAATEKTYLLNRGADWRLLNERIRFIGNLKTDKFTISMVVQANNFREIPLFIDLANKIGANTAEFGVINNWGTYSNSEFLQRAIHLPRHREYNEFLGILKNIAYKHNCVFLGNLNYLCSGKNYD